MQGIWPLAYIPSLGMSGRLTYATSDWYAYEAGLELEHSVGAANFAGPWNTASTEPDKRFGDIIEYMRRMAWMRGDFGISVRLGVQWIPTFYAGVGAQLQWASDTRQFIEGTKAGPGSQVALAVLGTVAAGLDYRMDEHWVFGTSVRARRALPALPVGNDGTYRGITIYFHIGYYWYPGNMNLAD